MVFSDNTRVVGKTGAPPVLPSFKVSALKLSTKVVDELDTCRGTVLRANGRCINMICV
jgi:hypothetical protein